MEKLIYCEDCSLSAMIAKTKKSGKWDLFAISEILGMGNADYDQKVFEFDFIDVVPLNSFSGKSYVCLNKNHKWGLLELKGVGKVQCEWKLTADFIYNDMDLMLKEMKIDKSKYSIN